ncbi:mucin-2-like [Drosophila novamexicana]|uniref:mucin-2-like n=1 Tax=Drosophila novamexicana TaxID=47314 RepID=UPI0011E5B884|nr:mucin-2-like [Drosophila novamexicana]
MSSRRSTSWASVVATGIIDEPLRLPNNVRPGPPKPMLRMPTAKGKTTAAAAATATATPLTTLSPTMTLKTTPAIPPTSIPTTALAQNSEQVVGNTSPKPAPLKPPMPTSTPRAAHSSPNRIPTSNDFRRPFRSVWPRQPTPFPDHRHHHRSSSQGGTYRPRRHHNEFRTRTACPYGTSSGQVHPRCPAPMNWQPRGPRPMMKPLIAGYGNLMQPEKRMLSTFYTPMRMPAPLSIEQKPLLQPGQPQTVAYNWEQQHYRPTMPDIHEESVPLVQQNYEDHDGDNQQGRRACVSPRARSRCQVTLSHSQYDMTQWQPLCESRQVWEPLDRNRGQLDPSNPIPPPPPGFEHVVTGKRSVSSRARKLMGDQVKIGPHTDYPTPMPMEMPERELREQQHFIAKHDTHLTSRLAQLRVTNGTTGDGYYVRPVTKLIPKATKVLVPPKYQPLFQPNVSYWELLRRNQAKGEAMDHDQGQHMEKIMLMEDQAKASQAETFTKIQSAGGEQDIYPNEFKTEPIFTPAVPFQFLTGSTGTADPTIDYSVTNYAADAYNDLKTLKQSSTSEFN